MAREFTDALVSRVLISVEDMKGRRASLAFGESGITLHRRRPAEGKKAEISYDQLFDLVASYNGDFFRAPKPRKKLS